LQPGIVRTGEAGLEVLALLAERLAPPDLLHQVQRFELAHRQFADAVEAVQDRIGVVPTRRHAEMRAS